MASVCGPFNKSSYKQSGPIRVSRDGPYYFSDTSMKWSIQYMSAGLYGAG